MVWTTHREVSASRRQGQARKSMQSMQVCRRPCPPAGMGQSSAYFILSLRKVCRVVIRGSARATWAPAYLHTSLKKVCTALAHSCRRTGPPAYLHTLHTFFQFKRKKVSITKRHRWYGPRIAKSQQAGYWDKLEKVCKVCKYAGGPVVPQEWVRAVHTLF